LGSQITAELYPDVAGTSPIYEGRVYQIGQIGSLVRIPQGTVNLVGSVTMLGIAELIPPLQPAVIPQQGDRWIQFQLIGELDRTGLFYRGVSGYPALDDPVHFATHDEISSIFPIGSAGWIKIGCLSTSGGEGVYLDLGRLVMRHTAVVGSTGSGKSSTVARILQSILATGMHHANVVVIDPHGEYSTALVEHALVQSVVETRGVPLSVPYWALSFDDLLQIYGRGEKNPIIRNRLQEFILSEKKAFLARAGWTVPRLEDVTVDTPVPFDLREVWYHLDFENQATYPQVNSQGTACVLRAGDPITLTPTEFQPYSLGSAAPFKGKSFGQYSPLPDRFRIKLTDGRFKFLTREWPDPEGPDPLPAYICKWLGDNQPVSILDFSGVPPESADIAIGCVLNLLFVTASSSADGVGRSRPILIVLEEAHRFLGKTSQASTGLAREAAERIAREGRKYGVGIMLVSQRPSELSDTALSQCGTIISMRLTNPTDQASVRAALPDSIAGLAEALPALRTGEALVTGEAVALPCRVVVDRPHPEPHASDPSIASWIGSAEKNDVKAAINRWRGAVEDN